MQCRLGLAATLTESGTASGYYTHADGLTGKIINVAGGVANYLYGVNGDSQVIATGAFTAEFIWKFTAETEGSNLRFIAGVGDGSGSPGAAQGA